MKTLIIYAHPQTPGHNPHILEEVTAQLKGHHISFEVLDLYKIKFNPVLGKEEHYTSVKAKPGKDVLVIQKKIKANDRLIFIYPVWWGSMPAIMKGFFDRVFTSHFAFQYVNRIPMGLLKNKKALILTTSGAPNSVSYLLQGNRSNSIIRTDILFFCGIKSKMLNLGSATHWDDSKIPKIKKMVEKGISWLY